MTDKERDREAAQKLWQTCKDAVGHNVRYKGTNGNENEEYHGEPISGVGLCKSYHDSHGLSIIVEEFGSEICVDPIEVEILPDKPQIPTPEVPDAPELPTREEYYASTKFKTLRMLNQMTHEIVQQTQRLYDMLELIMEQHPGVVAMDKFSLYERQLRIVNIEANNLITAETKLHSMLSYKAYKGELDFGPPKD